MRTSKNPGAGRTASRADHRHASEKRGDHKQATGVPQRRIDFERINAAALARLPALLARWLPGGKRAGREYVALNPTRTDRAAGSFRINVATGRWADFATGDKGGDPVSLFAYLRRCGQIPAAFELACTIGADPYEREARRWVR